MRPEVAAFLARIAELNLQPVPADPDRATADYPRMPAGTCYLSSRALAEIYPELTVVYGRLSWRQSDLPIEMDHAWNVTPDGRIVDSTLRQNDDAQDIRYTPEKGNQP